MPRHRKITTLASPLALTPVRQPLIKQESLSPIQRLAASTRIRRPTWKAASRAFAEAANVAQNHGDLPLIPDNAQSTTKTNRFDTRTMSLSPEIVAALPRSRRRVSTGGARQAERAIIDELRARILKLERSEKRLKVRSRERLEELKDLSEEAKGRLILLVEAESKLEETARSLQIAREEAIRFRNWWLAEYHGLKAIIQLIPRRHDVEAVAAEAAARYKAFGGN
ncbi:hypothetical protein NMY22_g3126 [Coprinellus aureogranulatus]|nr:hypothetical protein NMY22_g3126 [Coprinellus aureogranulatus]